MAFEDRKAEVSTPESLYTSIIENAIDGHKNIFMCSHTLSLTGEKMPTIFELPESL